MLVTYLSLVYLYTGLRWLHTEKKVFSLLVHWSEMGKSLVYLYTGLRWLHTGILESL